MIFDIFHSVGRIDSISPSRDDQQVFRDFFSEARLAETLGFSTIWVAESHFSSEVQKTGPEPVIQNYQGEVGLCCDQMQLAHALFDQTKAIGFGTAIHNIVGGSGGPIASADRVRTLAHLNSLKEKPRDIHIGVASGRFPYINRPFGIVPRDEQEELLWPQIKRLIFLESLEIFLRLSIGETICSEDISNWSIDRSLFRSDEDFGNAAKKLGLSEETNSFEYNKRFKFESIKLVPNLSKQASEHLKFVLGSHDPMAREVASKYCDFDIFNLSFTPSDAIAKVHEEMTTRNNSLGRSWHRHRMPRTVLIFIDETEAKAKDKASQCFDTYIEAMKGTVQLPPKELLMSRALIGEPNQIVEQMGESQAMQIHPDDRLMLWFEFNQSDSTSIQKQMELFGRKVAPQLN